MVPARRGVAQAVPVVQEPTLEQGKEGEGSMKLCECGCGNPTYPAPRTGNGYRKGELIRYLPDHYRITEEERLKRNARLGTLEDRFWRYVNKNGPIVKQELGRCWSWTACIQKNGYGYLRFLGRNRGAHCVAYELFKSKIPDGLQVDHLCKNRSCCNPYHLEAVTIRVNVLRGDGITAKNAVKTHCVNGHEFTPANTKLKFNKKHKAIWANLQDVRS